MRKHVFFIIFGIFFTTALNAQFYSDSAYSTAMNGAHTASSLDGFESMMFNPAGLAARKSAFGLHILGTLGMNLYSNSFNATTALDIIEQLQDGNGDIERFISNMRKQNLNTGVQAGFQMDYNIFKFYFHTKYLSFGFSDTLKMRARMFVGDDLFSTIFDEINLNNKQSLGTIGADLLAYNDLNSTFSLYLWMLEHKTPFRGFYVGGGVHIYTPIVHSSAEFSGKLGKGSLGSKIDVNQVDANLYTYNLELDGKISLASPAASSWDTFGVPIIKDFSKGQGIPFGLGFDLGLIIDFNKWVRAGFSVTDLGFMMSPSTEFEIDKTISIDLQDMGNTGSEFSKIVDDFSGNGIGGTESILAPLAMRLGATATPYSNRFIELECPITFTVTDFDLITLGFYPTFGVSFGVDFTVKAGIFRMPLWTSLGYFTSSGISLGLGGGLHIGVCHLDLGVCGLESLMNPASDSAWGRNIAFSVQLSFQLDKKAEKQAKKSKTRTLKATANVQADETTFDEETADSPIPDETASDSQASDEEISDSQTSDEAASDSQASDKETSDSQASNETASDKETPPTP